jgi:hypothetical protein
VARLAVTALATGATLAACGGSPPAEDPNVPVAEPGFGPVHGLGRNPADGRVYAATHVGVFRLDPDGPHRIADRHRDTMGGRAERCDATQHNSPGLAAWRHFARVVGRCPPQIARVTVSVTSLHPAA